MRRVTGRARKKADVAGQPDLARLKRMFEEARDLTAQARLEALTDIDYFARVIHAATDEVLLKDYSLVVGAADTPDGRLVPAPTR